MRYLIYIIIFFSFFDLFTQLPVMSPFAESLGATAFITGLIVGMYSLTNTFGNIISGFWTDRSGSLPVLLFGLFATGISLFCYALVETPSVLLLIRFVHGFVGGFIVPAAFAFLSNITVKEKRGQGGAISGALIGIAAISGPAYSGILASKTNVPVIFITTGVCLLILGIVSLFVFKKSNPPSKTKKAVNEERIASFKFLRNIGVIKAYSGAFFLMFAQGAIAYLLPLRVQDLDFGAHITGTLLSTFGVVAVLIFLLPTNRLFDKVLPTFTLCIGAALMGLALLMLSAVEGIFWLYIAMAFYGAGFAFLFPSINSLMIDFTTDQERGKAYGYFYCFFSIGTVAGSTLLGWLNLGNQHGLVFTGIILLVFSIIMLGLREKHVEKNA
ncbi:MFS transporter [Ureibacillus terrenus]|uniref:MFS transporter n=1 Tax=Ureibacillus terrenus TaxID=118246 RepID=UPI002E1C8904|nr:MFS transporter [Ureibacillus terrenus]